jgi:hypothetical protein
MADYFQAARLHSDKNFLCQRCAMPQQPNGYSARLSAIHPIRSLASSTRIWRPSTAQPSQI